MTSSEFVEAALQWEANECALSSEELTAHDRDLLERRQTNLERAMEHSGWYFGEDGEVLHREPFAPLQEMADECS